MLAGSDVWSRMKYMTSSGPTLYNEVHDLCTSGPTLYNEVHNQVNGSEIRVYSVAHPLPV